MLKSKQRRMLKSKQRRILKSMQRRILKSKQRMTLKYNFCMYGKYVLSLKTTLKLYNPSSNKQTNYLNVKQIREKSTVCPVRHSERVTLLEVTWNTKAWLAICCCIDQESPTQILLSLKHVTSQVYRASWGAQKNMTERSLARRPWKVYWWFGLKKERFFGPRCSNFNFLIF